MAGRREGSRDEVLAREQVMAPKRAPAAELTTAELPTGNTAPRVGTSSPAVVGGGVFDLCEGCHMYHGSVNVHINCLTGHLRGARQAVIAAVLATHGKAVGA